MKKIIYIVVAFALFTGCSTKSSFEQANSQITVDKDAKFTCGEVIDNTGFVFKENEAKIVLSDAMRSALTAALQTANIDGSGYILQTTILHYSPGNAFSRWLVPGTGKTKLSVLCSVYTKENILVAKIPVERSIAAGGGYTIGAWKYVFEDVSKEIVNLLKEHFLGINRKAKSE